MIIYLHALWSCVVVCNTHIQDLEYDDDNSEYEVGGSNRIVTL